MKFFRRKKTAAAGTEVTAEPSTPPSAEVDAVAAETVSDPQPLSATEIAVAPVAVSANEQSRDSESVPKSEPMPEAKVDGGMFARLKRGLSRTSEQLGSGLGNLFLGRKEIDADLLEDLESELLMADVGMEATVEIVGRLAERVSRKELADAGALYRGLQDELASLLHGVEQPLVIDTRKKPYVILMVGVNGVGKTTTIGKLARSFQNQGLSVMLAAGDTFRAAAVEQLQVWGERNQVPVVAQHTGADSASVIFDAVQSAQARNVDVLIADTAGRMHNKDNLMDELKKVVRVIGKLDDTAPHEVMLVLDAGTGQNALAQAEHFGKAVGVSGITLSKLDGTAKGGIIFAIARKLALPIRFIGVGEALEDLRPFSAAEFVSAIFPESDQQ
tara:strand:- start:236 stop:1399 length:1164 start_codon:yes stop_codon:yes gene_type:complete